MRFYFHEYAETEFIKAIDYYENSRHGLGIEFAQEVYAAIDRIIQFPEAWSPMSKNIRRCIVNRFPFGIIYQMKHDFVRIIAVAVNHFFIIKHIHIQIHLTLMGPCPERPNDPTYFPFPLNLKMKLSLLIMFKKKMFPFLSTSNPPTSVMPTSATLSSSRSIIYFSSRFRLFDSPLIL